jgi:hypothetical protein
VKATFHYPAGIEPLTDAEMVSMLEQGELSASVFYRRNTLIALTELAARAKGSHDPLSRWRLKTFRAALDATEGNDEVEVTGETLCETVMLALTYVARR